MAEETNIILANRTDAQGTIEIVLQLTPGLAVPTTVKALV